MSYFVVRFHSLGMFSAWFHAWILTWIFVSNPGPLVSLLKDAILPPGGWATWRVWRVTSSTLSLHCRISQLWKWITVHSDHHRFLSSWNPIILLQAVLAVTPELLIRPYESCQGLRGRESGAYFKIKTIFTCIYMETHDTSMVSARKTQLHC